MVVCNMAACEVERGLMGRGTVLPARGKSERRARVFDCLLWWTTPSEVTGGA